MATEFSRAIRRSGHPGAFLVFAVIGLLLAWSSDAPSLPHAAFHPPHRYRPPDAELKALAETGPVTRLIPQGNVRGVILLLSDRDGWTAAMQHDAKLLS